TRARTSRRPLPASRSIGPVCHRPSVERHPQAQDESRPAPSAPALARARSARQNPCEHHFARAHKPSRHNPEDETLVKPLEGLLVVSLEQAVAAPMTSRRLADAGARVIKLERPEGDFARGYDAVVHGLSSYFVWLNRGKESIVADLTRAEDRALFEA